MYIIGGAGFYLVYKGINEYKKLHKINKLTPKTRIKILSDNELKKYDKIACIILAWNISNLLKIKLKKINKNIKFINS